MAFDYKKEYKEFYLPPRKTADHRDPFHAVVVFLVIILGVVGGIAGASGSSSSEALSQEVLAYTATIQRYASEFGIPEYVASIQAIMMQESGGRGNRSHAGQRVPLQYGISQYTGRDHRPGVLHPGGNPVVRRLRHPGRGAKALPISAGFS